MQLFKDKNGNHGFRCKNKRLLKQTILKYRIIYLTLFVINTFIENYSPKRRKCSMKPSCYFNLATKNKIHQPQGR